MSQAPDWTNYLLWTLIMYQPGTDIQLQTIREMAGTLLKTSVMQGVNRLDPSVLQTLQQALLQLVADSSQSIRRTAANVITTVVSAIGLQGCVHFDA